jgi:Ser/Thr protein kinase RdoA (MazF antagonist)
MTDRPLPIIHSILDAEALGRVIQAHWDLADPFHCELLTRGMNDVYLVRSGTTRFAARCWRTAGFGEDKVDYELKLLDFLDRDGLPVVAPVAAKDGSWSTGVQAPEGPRPVALFRWVNGGPLHDHPNPVPYARRLGELFARMHLAGSRFHPAPSRMADYAGKIRRGWPNVKRLCGHRPEDLRFYEQAIDAVAGGLERLDRRLLPWGHTHGDIHAHNALIDQRGRMIIMDFDSGGEDFFGQELVSLVWAGRKNGFPLPAIQAFLDGYDSVRPRTAEERAAEPLFMAGKEMRYFCGFAGAVNAIGHKPFRYPGLDWFAASVRKHVAAAGLI